MLYPCSELCICRALQDTLLASLLPLALPYRLLLPAAECNAGVWVNVVASAQPALAPACNHEHSVLSASHVHVCSFAEEDVVKMHSLLGVCGFHLRSEDPSALKVPPPFPASSHLPSLTPFSIHALKAMSNTLKQDRIAIADVNNSISS